MIILLHFLLYGVAYNICAVANNTDLYVLGSNNHNTIDLHDCLTLPVWTATIEHDYVTSVLALRCILHWLCSTMSHDRFSSLSVRNTLPSRQHQVNN